MSKISKARIFIFVIISCETVKSPSVLVDHTRSFSLGIESSYGSNNGLVVSGGSTSKPRVRSVVVVLA